MLHKLYQKKKLLSRAAETACVPYCLTAALTAYASYACAWTGAPLPEWYAAGAWITAGVPAAALIAGAVIGAARMVREARTPRRMGIIPADEICRILERGGSVERKYSWWLVRGNPLCDRPCKILLVDGTEEVAHYNGYFDARQRQWTMYIIKSYAGRLKYGKATCAEADVIDRRKQ